MSLLLYKQERHLLLVELIWQDMIVPLGKNNLLDNR